MHNGDKFDYIGVIRGQVFHSYKNLLSGETTEKDRTYKCKNFAPFLHGVKLLTSFFFFKVFFSVVLFFEEKIGLFLRLFFSR